MIFPIRLPKPLETDPRKEDILRKLAARTRLLWPGGTLEVPSTELNSGLAAVLQKANTAGQIIRGYESAEKKLGKEQQGLAMADQKTGVQRGMRISRLLILSNDGSERFYRGVESLLRRNGPRVFAVHLEADSLRLGELLFGHGRMARLIMIDHKDHVTAVLLALGE